MEGHKKGQYFSFDAIIATVIMTAAFTSLLVYWLGAQQVIESRTSPLYSDAIRIADSLFGPGSPVDWNKGGTIRQIGLTEGLGNQLSQAKANALPGDAVLAALLRAPYSPGIAGYRVIVEQTDGASPGYSKSVGTDPPADAKEVAIAHRGGFMGQPDPADPSKYSKFFPVRLTVIVWRK